jgi:hypothetical protein
MARELATKSREFDRAQDMAHRLANDIAQAIGNSRGTSFLLSAIAPANNVLDEMRKDNLLPADIADGFLDRLLASKTCVCGRGLTPHDDVTARTHVTEFRGRALSADVNTGLTSLLRRLDRGTEHSFSKCAESSADSLSKLLKDRSSALIKARDLEIDVKRLSEDLKKSNHIEVRKAQQQQQNALQRRDDAAKRKKMAQDELRMLRASLDKARKDLHQIGGGKVDYRVEQLDKIVLRSDKLLDLLKRSLAALRDSFHTILQQSVTLHYDGAVTDGSRGVVDPNTLIPSMRVNGVVIHNIGGGQRQLLTLAHSVSLAQLRRELHEELQSLGLVAGKLDEQSFFFDSIFAPTDENYSRKIAEFLPEKTHQLVVLLASQQWQEWTRASLENAATSAYYIQLHSPNPPVDADMTFRGKKLQCYKKIPKGEEAYSTLIPIE